MNNPFAKKNDMPRRRTGSSQQPKNSGASDKSLFRRNRTLVGSLSASVSSASEMDASLRSPRAQAHHLSAHRKRLSGILTLIVLMSAFLIWFLYEFTASVSVNSANGGLVIDGGKYEKIITSYLNAHPAERLRITLNHKQLTAYVSREAPEVSDVRANGSAGFATSRFDIGFREPLASWLIGSNQYYVDKTGVSYTVNYFEEPAVRIVDQSGVPQSSGSTVASSRFLQFIGRTVDTATSRGLTIERAVIPSGATRQVELFASGHSYPIRMSLDRSVGEQVEDIERALKYFDEKGQSPQYVDVRVSGKVFYR
jgi:hypothetical protein